MGLFDSMFSNTQQLPSTWKTLQSKEELDQLTEDSHDKTVVIYKHSTSCSLNSVKIKELNRDWNLEEEQLDFYYLDLLRYRSLSNEIEKRFGIRHESPQILVIKNGEVTFHNSHLAVSVESIKNAL